MTIQARYGSSSNTPKYVKTSYASKSVGAARLGEDRDVGGGRGGGGVGGEGGGGGGGTTRSYIAGAIRYSFERAVSV